MKNLYFLSLLLFSPLLHSMEQSELNKKADIQSKITNEIHKSYEYIANNNLYKKYEDDSWNLLNAIAKQDITEITRIIENFPQEASFALLNNPTVLFEFRHAYDYEKKQKYLALTNLIKSLEANSLDFYSITPLCLAIIGGEEEIVKLLLTLNADINVNADTLNPLRAAVKYNPKFIPFLVACGADINEAHKEEPPIFITAQRDGSLESAQALIKAGASLHVKEPLLGLTPLHVACNNGQYEVAKCFLENGAQSMLLIKAI